MLASGAIGHCSGPPHRQFLLMITLLTILVGLGMLATLGTLFAGMLGLSQEGAGGRSNMLMRWRVLVQGATLALFALLLLLTRS